MYYVSILDSLKKAYPNCNNIPQDYELAFYTAISHYPELKETNIEMKLKSFNYSMAARPAKKLLANRKKRIYRIYANIKKDFAGVLPSRLNYNRKTGIIGHELGHVLDYSNKSLCKMIGTGIGYMSGAYRRKLEAKTDIEAIRHGLGWQLYDFNDYLYNYSDANEKYKKKKKKVYMDEKEIKELILKNYK
ncbi:MAG TPA: hypothetical protein PKL96_10100 [Bacteroidales bacterium]|nr:hypothetical protein [Bacteroidales bacterium]